MSLSSKQILIVEDDRAIRETFASILESEGYYVTRTCNGKEALDYLHHGVLPNLILLDLMMPVMDGYAFRKEQLKSKEWSHIPVVVLSARGELQPSFIEGDSLSWLNKPIELDVFLGQISKVLVHESIS
jgi:CheY-like chemotaxis protein